MGFKSRKYGDRVYSLHHYATVYCVNIQIEERMLFIVKIWSMLNLIAYNINLLEHFY